MYIKVQPYPVYYGPMSPYKIPKKQKKWYQCFEHNWFKSVGRFIEIYITNSAIHGFKYFVKKGLTLFEKCFWMLLVLFSLYFFFDIAITSMRRFQSKNTVMSLERDLYFWQTSLPSVTMCPLNRLDQALFDKYCRKRKIDGREKLELQELLESLANATYTNLNKIPHYDGVDKTLKMLNIKPKHYMSLIYNLTVDYATISDETQRAVAEKGDESIQVRQVLTEFGLCYLTNSHLANEYSSKYLLIGKYPKIDNSFTKVKSASYFQKQVDYTLKGPSSWKPAANYIHNPFDVMKIDSNYEYVEYGIYYYVGSNEISTEDGFEKKANVQQRNCRFPHESNLTHFPIYTKNLCLQECRLNMVYEKCACIPHFYPNSLESPKPVCSYKALKGCVFRHQDFFVKMYSVSKKKVQSCNCVANCREGLLTIDEVTILLHPNVMYKGIFSYVEVTTWPVTRFKRQVIYTFTDLLVSIGGTAGLLLGFSVLGAVEFIYYFTLRLICYLRGYVI